MKIRFFPTALTLLLALTTGCSMTHGDPKKPAKNPHPVQRYEVTATSEAPGPWDSVKGYLEYQVVNPECTPEDKFLGEHAMPQIVGHDFEMIRVDENTWKGYFYRDFMRDEDYYGLGICHWVPSSVSAVFVADEVAFGSGAVFADFMRGGSQTEYFKKSAYGNLKLVRDGALDYSAINPEYIKNPDAFFPITVTVKEVAP
jgi:hypothetical protein